MKTINKLRDYRDRLEAWNSARKANPNDLSHRNFAEPKPEEFGLISQSEKFMALKIRDQVIKD